jgi:hypothetical protein
MQSDEKFEAIGAFEPREVKRVVALLEAQEIPFDLQADNSALSNPVRGVQQPHPCHQPITNTWLPRKPRRSTILTY